MDDRMFGIKLVSAAHFEFPSFKNGQPMLMNFKDSEKNRAIAAGIPVGHRSVVFQTAPLHRYRCAIQFVGGMLKGEELAHVQHAAVAARLRAEWAAILLPIRVTAWIDELCDAPTRDDIEKATGFSLTPFPGPMRYIAEREYRTLIKAIKWSWVDESISAAGT